jgi:ribosome-binding protein aMBF1 (putative translation factor)
MRSFATLFKDEIRRLAQRVVRAETRPLRGISGYHRREIAQLKRRLDRQQRELRALESRVERLFGRPEHPPENHLLAGVRFSARSVRAQRKRLGLSAAEYGRLIGVSAQTVYHWEQGKARPQKAQFRSLIGLRGIGRREARKRLAQAE